MQPFNYVADAEKRIAETRSECAREAKRMDDVRARYKELKQRRFQR